MCVIFVNSIVHRYEILTLGQHDGQHATMTISSASCSPPRLLQVVSYHMLKQELIDFHPHRPLPFKIFEFFKNTVVSMPDHYYIEGI